MNVVLNMADAGMGGMVSVFVPLATFRLLNTFSPASQDGFLFPLIHPSSFAC
jgi:hypothetical protein